jgi:DNA modification methylase
VRPYYDHGGVTIYHGDCREVLGDIDAAVMVTDPPYGIACSSGRGGKFFDAEIVGDGNTTARDEALCLWGDRPALVFGSWKMPRPRGVRHVLTWEKGDHVGMGDLSIPWRPNTEEIYVLGSGFSGHRGSSVLRVNAPSPNFTPARQRYHPTEKPVRLMLVLLSKCPSGTIADPFAGSGSTLVAAKNLGRRAIGIEIEERYCEIAARRLSQEVLPLTPPEAA